MKKVRNLQKLIPLLPLLLLAILFIFLPIKPAGITRQQLKMKLESSPTPPVILENRLIMFFTRHTNTPATGPIVSEAITAGKSEKSNEIKLGISGTLILNSISTDDIAARSAVKTSFLTSKTICALFPVVCVCIKIILSISAPKVTFSFSPKNKSPVLSGL